MALSAVFLCGFLAHVTASGPIGKIIGKAFAAVPFNEPEEGSTHDHVSAYLLVEQCDRGPIGGPPASLCPLLCS